jgi:hypothetical protein
MFLWQFGEALAHMAAGLHYLEVYSGSPAQDGEILHPRHQHDA